MNKIQRYPVEKFFSVRTIFGFTTSANDKKIFYITNTTGSPQIWVIPTEGGWTDQLSTWNDSVKGVYHNPKTRELVFMSDLSGNENLQIYKMPDEGGDVEHLTKDFDHSQCFFHQFNKKGDKLLFSTNKRLKFNYDVYVQDMKTKKNRSIKKFEDHYPTHAEAWSNDERYYTFLRFYDNINTDILLLDSKENIFVNLTEHDLDNKVFNGATEFGSDSKGFYYITDEDREFKAIKYYDIKKKKSCRGKKVV